MRQPWTPAEEALLLDKVQGGWQPFDIYNLFKERGIRRTQKSIVRKLQNMRRKDCATWSAQVPASPMRKYNKPLVVEGDALVLADIHAPFHDAAWINRVSALALRMGIERCIIAGDLADFSAFSVFGREVDADVELDVLSRVMDTLSANFEVWYFAGNHDVRPVRRLRDAGLNVKWIMQMFVPSQRCHISDYFWCDLVSGGRKFRIEHPKNTSINAGVVPAKLAAKYRCSVIGAHGHVWGMSRDVSGRDWAIDSGVCCDPDRVAYVSQRHNTRPALYRGAVIVTDGIPLLLGPDNIRFYER